MMKAQEAAAIAEAARDSAVGSDKRKQTMTLVLERIRTVAAMGGRTLELDLASWTCGTLVTDDDVRGSLTALGYGVASASPGASGNAPSNAPGIDGKAAGSAVITVTW